MTIEAVIFDLDGLLVDSEPVWNEARVAMAAHHGQTWTLADHYQVMGVNTDEWAAYMIKRLKLSMSVKEVREEVIDEMVAMYQRQIPFRPFAIEAVQWSAAHYPTALASGSPRRLIEIVTQVPELQGCFREILVGDEVGEGKPHPAVYLETARKMGLAPELCVCLEDSPNGVLAGYRAGMAVINIPDPRYPLTAEQANYADLVLESLGEFNIEAINKLKRE